RRPSSTSPRRSTTRRSNAWPGPSGSVSGDRRREFARPAHPSSNRRSLMRAAVYEGEGQLVVRDVPDPVPAPDEVLIEVEACGVCGSDVQIINVPPGHPSTPPVILGHEFVGWVRGVGSAVRDVAIGSRVLVDPDPKCGACESCRAGRPANCTNVVALGVHRDGALARFVTAPADSIYTISPDVSAEMAALVEPLACVV